MLRRLLPALAVVLTLGLTAGCADDVAPAARYGDFTITHDELMDEVAQWARSPDLVEIITQGGTAGAPPRYSSRLVAVVLQNRIAFDTYDAVLQEQGLQIDPAILEQQRAQLVGDPARTAEVLGDLDPAFSERLVNEVATLLTVQNQGDERALESLERAFADVEINPRYGTWDARQGAVVPPEGPRPAPGDLPFEP